YFRLSGRFRREAAGHSPRERERQFRTPAHHSYFHVTSIAFRHRMQIRALVATVFPGPAAGVTLSPTFSYWDNDLISPLSTRSTEWQREVRETNWVGLSHNNRSQTNVQRSACSARRRSKCSH